MAIETGLQAVIVDQAANAAEDADQRWRADPAGRQLLGMDDLSSTARASPTRLPPRSGPGRGGSWNSSARKAIPSAHRPGGCPLASMASAWP